jgi:hypothetical protein
LYPDGFAVVPLALMKQAGKKAKHLAVFSALYSLAYQEGALLVARDARNRRLCERAGVSRNTLRLVLTDLEEWGYVDVRRRAGFPTTYVLLPVESDVSAALEVDRVEDRANHPEIAAVRGAASGDDPPRDSEQGVEQRQPEAPRADLPYPPRSSDTGPAPELRALHKTLQDASLDGGCDEPHPLFNDATRVKNLRKAVGRHAADAAIDEVAFRLEHPGAAGAVSEPWALARAIGECYAGRCRDDSHSELHGGSAKDYHRGRRADFAATERQRFAVVQRGTTYEDEIAAGQTLDDERERQKRTLDLVEATSRKMGME